MSRRGTAKGHEIDGTARVSNGPAPPRNRVRPGDRVTFINFEGDMGAGSVVRSSSAGLEHSRPVVGQLFLMSAMGGKWTLADETTAVRKSLSGRPERSISEFPDDSSRWRARIAAWKQGAVS